MSKKRENIYSDSNMNMVQKRPTLHIDWDRHDNVKTTKTSIKRIWAKNKKTGKHYEFNSTCYPNDYIRYLERGIDPDYFQSGLSYYTVPEVKEILKDQSEWEGHVEYYPEKIWTAEDYKIVADYYYGKYQNLKEKLKTIGMEDIDGL